MPACIPSMARRDEIERAASSSNASSGLAAMAYWANPGVDVTVTPDSRTESGRTPCAVYLALTRLDCATAARGLHSSWAQPSVPEEGRRWKALPESKYRLVTS